MSRLYWYLKVFGFQGLLVGFFAVAIKKSVTVRVYSSVLRRWVSVRTKTSDLAVFEKVINDEEYALPANIHPKVIVDAGANVGFSALYFSAKYPKAVVIAIEPDSSNFKLLQSNTIGCKNIYALKAAIWKTNTSVNLSGGNNSDFQVTLVGNDREVDGITIDKLMNIFAVSYVDVMKIDIEGAEKEVFETPQLWIDKIDMIVIELHDRLKPGCSESVKSAVAAFETTWEYGENTFFMRGKRG